MKMAARARTVTRLSIRKASAWQSISSHPSIEPHSSSSKDTDSGRYIHESLGTDSVYDLYAVVVHTGAVLAGHYFSFMRPEVCASTPLPALQPN
jgi:hypothetical protein